MFRFSVDMEIDFNSLPRRNFWAKPLNNFNTTRFMITGIDGLPCAYCGQAMISTNTLHDVFDKRDPNEKLYIDRALKLKDYLRPFYKKALEFMEKIKLEKGCETDHEIFEEAIKASREQNKIDILQRIRELTDIINNSTNEDLKNRFEFSKKYLYKKTLNSSSIEPFVAFIRSAKHLGVPRHSKTKDSIALNNFLDEILSPENRLLGKFILATIYKDTPNYTYKVYFKTAMSTIDHVKSINAGGRNEISNYLAVCEDCNYNKSKRHISSIMTAEVEKNIKEQLNILETAIPGMVTEHKLPEEYLEYTKKIRKLLRGLTGKNFGNSY